MSKRASKVNMGRMLSHIHGLSWVSLLWALMLLAFCLLTIGLMINDFRILQNVRSGEYALDSSSLISVPDEFNEAEFKRIIEFYNTKTKQFEELSKKM